MKAAAKPPLECGVYTPPSGLALPPRRSPKRRMIAALRRRLWRPRPGRRCRSRRPCGFSPPAHRSPHESGGEAALGVRRLYAAFGLSFTSPPQPKAANDRRTPRRLRRPRPGRRCCSLIGLAASPHRHAVVPKKAAAKPPLECGAYAPPSGFALPPRYSPKRRMIAALQSAFGAHVLAEGVVHSPALRLRPTGTP